MALSRKFLEGLLSEYIEKAQLEDVVSKIAETHSETLKSVVEEARVLKETVAQRDQDIETLKTTADTATKTKIAEIEAKYEKEKVELASKLEAIEIDTVLTREIESAKAVDLDTVKKLIDYEAIKTSKDRSIEITNQIKGLQESKQFLFGHVEETKTLSTGAKVGSESTPPTKEIPNLI